MSEGLRNIMDANQQMVMQIVTLGTASLVAMVAVIVAGRIATSKGSWWAVLGGLAVCAGGLIAGFQMFLAARYGGWSL